MTATAAPTATQPTASSDDVVGSFDNCFTRQFGLPSERVQKKVLGFLTQEVQAFIARSPFLVMATSDATGRCDASPKGGRPGFVRALDDRHLLLPDVKGNRLFQSYLNMTANPHVGLIFFIPGVERTVRVNGRVRLVEAEEVRRLGASLDLNDPDEDAVLLQGIVLEVEEAYGHCPRSLHFADVWNTGTIEENRRRATP
jgi:hypothetical protein